MRSYRIISHSSEYGVIRGLHFKVISLCSNQIGAGTQWKILDVGVDIRKGSPTYGEFSRLNCRLKIKSNYLPKGFAHGFSVLSEKAEVMYKCDGFYNKQSEHGILYNDPDLRLIGRFRQTKRKFPKRILRTNSSGIESLIFYLTIPNDQDMLISMYYFRIRSNGMKVNTRNESIKATYSHTLRTFLTESTIIYRGYFC